MDLPRPLRWLLAFLLALVSLQLASAFVSMTLFGGDPWQRVVTGVLSLGAASGVIAALRIARSGRAAGAPRLLSTPAAAVLGTVGVALLTLTGVAIAVQAYEEAAWLVGGSPMVLAVVAAVILGLAAALGRGVVRELAERRAERGPPTRS